MAFSTVRRKRTPGRKSYQPVERTIAPTAQEVRAAASGRDNFWNLLFSA